MQTPEVTVIGVGALGTALIRAFSAQHILVKSIFNRTEKDAESLADEHDIAIASARPKARSELASLVFITVSDSAIPEVTRHLVQLDDDLSGMTVIHCSGNEPADILHPLRDRGAHIASMHPLQTFTSASGPTDFEDIYFSLHGDSNVFPMLQRIAQQLGAHTMEVTSQQKADLHAAAVFASNYLITLLQAATETASTAGLSEQNVKEALLPLVQTTLKNAKGQALPEALSGPIKRGDVKTIEDHLTLLNNQPELRSLYCNLGRKTVALAQSSGYLDEETAVELKEVLR
ncbi:Rossmann-like and DUF2520 domain-containing protein [Fodinibius salsisoli]|uniref:DUF2520 domain-containing protein n=1 Tax=Fodinibius salsisoli TaxID=2820877 RepID=A0ABT3PKM5_9BACT|nr:Rossmann-like and DUF2520 domain-containing protein [Fodinibius salsisoli]MCW9706405.1 DUF2520 domain-containing protein [Fodinibius salsisoli]